MQEKGNLIEDLVTGYRAERDGVSIRLVGAEGRRVAIIPGAGVRFEGRDPSEGPGEDRWYVGRAFGDAPNENATVLSLKENTLTTEVRETCKDLVRKRIKQTGRAVEAARNAQRLGLSCSPRGVSRGKSVTVLIPCHNEEDCVGQTVAALLRQTRPPDRIVVVVDNCTDGTAEAARLYEVEVWETVNNRHKKAGALNQALVKILPELKEDDSVLVMDADSFLDKSFVECAERKLAEGRYGGVGGTFQGRLGGAFVGMLQRNEFARYARDVHRLKGKVLCLTGTATLFPAKVLREVAKTRSTGEVYDVEVLTEDFELTLALRHLGYEVVSPKECTLSTEVMETWGDLARQRLRWKRGAVENLIQYGLTKVTLEHWARQLITFLGIFVMALYLGTLAFSLVLTHGGILLHPLWIGITAIFMVERAVTVYRRGWKMSLLAALLIFEMPFDLFLQAVHFRAYWQVAVRSERRW